MHLTQLEFNIHFQSNNAIPHQLMLKYVNLQIVCLVPANTTNEILAHNRGENYCHSCDRWKFNSEFCLDLNRMNKCSIKCKLCYKHTSTYTARQGQERLYASVAEQSIVHLFNDKAHEMPYLFSCITRVFEKVLESFFGEKNNVMTKGEWREYLKRTFPDYSFEELSQKVQT